MGISLFSASILLLGLGSGTVLLPVRIVSSSFLASSGEGSVGGRYSLR